MQKNAPPAGGRQGGNQGAVRAAVARSDNARYIRYHRQERGRRCGLFILLSNGLLIGVDWAAHSRNDAIDVVTAPAQGVSMLSVLIGVLIICIVGALCFLGHRQVCQRSTLGKPSQIAGGVNLPGGDPAAVAAAGGN